VNRPNLKLALTLIGPDFVIGKMFCVNLGDITEEGSFE
jgi:hypothetical protein